MLEGIRRARFIMARLTSIGLLRVDVLGMALVLTGASCAWGQSVISAHSGLIHYVEGKVLLEGQPVDPKFGDFPEVKNDQVLQTAEGRAEVLLTPGVFLRVAENSSFKMLSNRLSDTALEVLSGSAMVEVDELSKDNAITVRYKDATIALSKQGLYRVDADTERLRVYDGQADVTYAVKTVQVHKGKQVELNETLLASSFDTKDTDAFYRWVARRSEYISAANVSSARAAGNSSLYGSTPCATQGSPAPGPYVTPLATSTGTYPYGSPYDYSQYGGCYSQNGMWAWNPYYGMFTYLPGMGYGYNPFGWPIYSPMTVGSVYVPGNYGSSPLTNRSAGPTGLSSTGLSSVRSNSGVGSSSSGTGAGSGGSSRGGSSSSGGGGGIFSGSSGSHAGGSGGGHR